MAQKVRTYSPRINVTCKCGGSTMQSSLNKWTYYCLDLNCDITYVLQVKECQQ